jgi:ABC-2 type transport system permease protein
MRGHVIFAVLNRNLMSFFSGVAGYLFICVFVVAAALCAFNAQFFTNNLATLDQLTEAFPFLLLFIIPAITMTAWADEKRQGTDELLFTLPASDFEILLGKYLALVLVYSIALAFSLTNFVILAVYADPDWGMLITTYFGYWLAGAALISAGMFASVLTSNVTVAFVVGSVMCAVPVFVGIGTSHPLPEDASMTQVFGDTLVQFGQELSLGERLREFNLGVVPFSGLVYFGSLIAFFLYLNAGMIGRRHWVKQDGGIPVGLHFGLRAFCLVVALIAGNSMVSTASESIGLRFDMTSEKVYTLSDTTSEVLASVKKENPVTIQAFLSPDVPREFVSHHTQLRGLLRQYSRQAGARVEVRFVDVEPYSKEADEAARLGIQSQEVSSEVNGRFERMQIFMGAFIKSEFGQVVVPFFEQGASIEYELTRSISTVTQKNRATVGILRTDAQVSGGFDQATFRQIPAWRIQSELAKQYDVKDVSASSKIEDDIDMLIAVLPSSLTDAQMGNFVEYVNSGKPVLILDDPFPYNDLMQFGQPKNAPSQPKQAPQRNPMFGGGGPQPEPRADGGKATRLTNSLNIEWQNDQIVYDRTNPHPQFRDNLEDEFVFIHRNKSNPEAISTKSELTSGLEEVLVILAGSIKPRAKVKGEKQPDFTPLLWTGADDSGEVNFRTLLASLQVRSPPNREDDDEAHVIAARIAGEKTLAKVIVRKILNSFRIHLDELSDDDLKKRIKEVGDQKAADRSKADQRFWLVAQVAAAQEAFNKGDRKAERSIYSDLEDGLTDAVGSKKQVEELKEAFETIADDEDAGPPTDINTIYVADVDIVSDMMFNVAQTEVQGLKLDNVRFILNCVDFLAGDDKYVSLRNRRAKFRVLKYLDEQVREFREKAEDERIKADKDAKKALEKRTDDLDKEIEDIQNDDELTETEKRQRAQMAVETKRRQLEVEKGKIERKTEAKLKALDTRVKRQTQEEESSFRFHAVFWPPIPAILFGIVFLILRISSERMSIEESRRLS